MLGTLGWRVVDGIWEKTLGICTFFTPCTHVYIHNHTYTYQVGIYSPCLLIIWDFFILVLHAANYSSAGQHEQKNKKTTGPLKFSAVTIKQ